MSMLVIELASLGEGKLRSVHSYSEVRVIYIVSSRELGHNQR